jgi:hypothetical protein
MNPFDFIEERRREKEIERDMQARRGKMQIQRHINNQKKMSTKLWEMGKRAMELGDKRQFTSIGKQYLWTLEDVKRWERYLLAFESIEARRDQARSMSEFMKSVNAMSKSMMANSNPESIARTQKDLEVGLARAQNLEQMLDYMMDMTDETIFNTEMLGEDEQNDAIKALEQEMKRETAVEGEKATAQDSVDSRIADGLKAIEQEMRKDVSK